MRLIDADAMHKFVEEKVAEGKDGWANGVGYEWAWALTAVDMQPTIDAEPVRHGRWVDRYGGRYANPLYECSECREAALEKDELTVLDNWCIVQVLSAHCPNCGAKMDLEG